MKMKKYALLLILAPLFAAIFAFQKGGNLSKKESNDAWETSIETAYAKAKKNKKKVFVLFTGSDWCYWCKKLDGEVLSQKAFLDYASKEFVLLKLDFPRSGGPNAETLKLNREFATKFGVTGYPTVFITDASETSLHRTGYMQGGADAYVKALQLALKDK